MSTSNDASSSSSTTVVQTLCVVRHPGLKLPRFFLRRQMPIFDALGKAFGGKDIDFDDDPVFSRLFVLQAAHDEAAVRECFGQRARLHFNSLALKGVVAEGYGETLVLHFNRRLPVGEIDALVDATLKSAELWASPSA